MKLFINPSLRGAKRRSNLAFGIASSAFGLLAMTVALLSAVDLCYAANIRVGNVSLYKSATQAAGTIDIKFDVTWDASNADETNGLTDAQTVLTISTARGYSSSSGILPLWAIPLQGVRQVHIHGAMPSLLQAAFYLPSTPQPIQA